MHWAWLKCIDVQNMARSQLNWRLEENDISQRQTDLTNNNKFLAA